MNTEKNRGASVLRIFLVTALLSGIAGGAAQTWAADPPEPVESYYANPAQAAHAAQLAEQSVTTDKEVQAALKEFEDAQAEFDAAQAEFDAAQAALDALKDLYPDVPTPEEAAALAAAEQKLAEEQQALAAEQLELDVKETAYTGVVAETTGTISTDIAAMRASGMGWGDIAHELGVHPSTLGLGHGKKTGMQLPDTTVATGMKGIAPDELAEATARSTGSGKVKDHGQMQQSRIHEPGTGLASASSADETASGKAAAGKGAGTSSGNGDDTSASASGNGQGKGSEGSNAGGNSSSGGKGGNDSSSGPGNSDGPGNSGSSGNGKGDSGGNDKGNSGGNDKGNSGGNDKGNSGGNDKGNSGGNGKGGGMK